MWYPLSIKSLYFKSVLSPFCTYTVRPVLDLTLLFIYRRIPHSKVALPLFLNHFLKINLYLSKNERGEFPVSNHINLYMTVTGTSHTAPGVDDFNFKMTTHLV